MEGTGEIKYPRQAKTSTAALRLAEGSVKTRGRKPRKNSPGPPGWGLCEGPATHSCEAKDSQRRNGTEWFNGCRRKRVQRNMSNKLRIDTWNVKKLLKPGKMQELAEELAKTQLEIN